MLRSFENIELNGKVKPATTLCFAHHCVYYNGAGTYDIVNELI
jgi:hypothetical protein